MNADAFLDQFMEESFGDTDAQRFYKRLRQARIGKHLSRYCPADYATYVKCVEARGPDQCLNAKPAYDACLSSLCAFLGKS
jgi:hypothetical protein